jgi:hypothetical protein
MGLCLEKLIISHLMKKFLTFYGTEGTLLSYNDISPLLHFTYCNRPLPLNGQLVTDIISEATDTDSYPITRNGWAKCIRGNRYAL